MPDSFPFPMYSGLLEPEHYKKIGSAIWLFLWCVSATTAEKEEEGTVWGIVLGSKPVALPDLAEHFGIDEKTVRRWIKTLETSGYIRTKRAPYGLIFGVHNSKKFRKRSDINVQTEPRDRTKMSTLDDRDRTFLSQRSDINVHSNKDITGIYKDAASSASDDSDRIMDMAVEVEKHFCQRRGKGFDVSATDLAEIKQMLNDGIPVDLINRVVDESFAGYKPKHKRDEIRSITYCVPRCYDEWTKLQPGESITDAVPHVSVAIGSPPLPRQTKQQQELEDLRRRAKEERERGQSRSS